MAGEKIAVKVIWTRLCLIPFWVVQTFLILIALAFNALYLTAISYFRSQFDSTDTFCYSNSAWGDNCYYGGISDDQKSTINALLGIYVVILVLILVLFFLEVFQIVQYCRSRMTPPSYFGQQCFMFLVMTIMLILSIVGFVRNGSILNLVWYILNWLAFLSSFIYGSVIFGRFRSGRYKNVDIEINHHPQVQGVHH